MSIKEELKETRLARDNYKRKFDESVTYGGDKKTEIVNMLKNGFEKLISEIQITPKIKEILTVILRILDYSEENISVLLLKDPKKKNFFNIFK